MIDLKNIKPDIRHLKDMEEVVYDKEWLKTSAGDLELYYMYRGVDRKDGLRYDVTVIPAKMLGKEFVKTKGHQHSCKEVYDVLEGEVIFLIQETTPPHQNLGGGGKEKIVEDVYAIKGKKNDKITIPPNFDHIAINASEQELKIGNWMPEDCKNDYRTIEKMKGACYFYTTQGWLKNENYKKVPELRASDGMVDM